jgi:protein phosphatase
MSDPKMRSASEIVRPEQEAMGRSPNQSQLIARCFGLTDRGRVRTANEDQFLVARLVKSLEVQHTSLPQPKKRRSSDHTYLLVVADGVGGAAGGEQASALALDSVETYILETLQWFVSCRENEEDQLLTDFRKALGHAHGRVRQEAADHPHLRGMGTTLTLAYSLNDDLFLAHVGDSRCYLLRNNSLYRLTQDHTLVEEMLRRGALKAEEAANHRWRHVITSTVGGDSTSVRVDVHRLHLEAGDVLLLCSDGLTEMIPSDQIAQILAGGDDPETTCRRLVQMANDAGGKDNITVVTARYELLADADTDLLPPADTRTATNL